MEGEGSGPTGRSGRWLRRQERRRRERQRLAKHGAGLARLYAEAVRKRRQEKGRRQGRAP